MQQEVANTGPLETSWFFNFKVGKSTTGLVSYNPLLAPTLLVLMEGEFR